MHPPAATPGPPAGPPARPATPDDDAPGPEPGWVRQALGPRHPGAAPADRARGLLLLGLLGAAAVVMWLRLLALEPHLPLQWRSSPDGGVVLDAAGDPALRPYAGLPVQALLLADGSRLDAAALPPLRSARWVADGAERARLLRLADRLTEALRQPQLQVLLADGRQATVAPRPRGLAGLGAACWAVCALALALYLAAASMVLARPGVSAALYALLAVAQGVNLLLIGAEALPGLGLDPALLRADLPLRVLADACTAAALLHVTLIYPRRLPAARLLAGGVWALALGGAAAALWQAPPTLWWWLQGAMLASGLAAVAALQAARRHHGSALATLLQRLVLAGTATLALLSLAIVLGGRAGASEAATPHGLGAAGPAAWHVFVASLLLLRPFITRSRQVLREFALLAGIATVAGSLDLLFVALPGLNPLASLLLSLAVSLAVYAAARPWILGQLAGPSPLSAERMFDRLYRAARTLEQSPAQAPRQIAELLREVFDPLDLARSSGAVPQARVADDGSALVVPLPELPGAAPARPAGTLVLRHAHRGRRLFTAEDVQFAERLIEQLRRAVAYDRAVEHGRSEERLRIAQDLHDDIGARLLTLMYKAPNPEIEDYIRHTLQDLKTLTRGLAASSHRLSHAAAEWKADLTQRLHATGCDLQWAFSIDRDLTLTVVQWSALTRVLRELANNIITHAQATQVEITAQLERGELQLQVSDDGVGRAPETWSMGLGLGGVRKRVKLLGGQVHWLERAPCGIRCEVRVRLTDDAG